MGGRSRALRGVWTELLKGMGSGVGSWQVWGGSLSWTFLHGVAEAASPRAPLGPGLPTAVMRTDVPSVTQE